MTARFAQHFLVEKEAIQKILYSLALSVQDSVLEIGPGQGALTGSLISSGSKIFAVEIDPVMVEELQKRFPPSENFSLIHKDFLQFDFNLLPPVSDDKKYKVAGNLPYNITSPILRKLSEWNNWSFAVIMVQKEVGDRLCASPGNKEYGAITVGVSLTCEVENLFDLEPTAFRPKPKVRSSVLRLTRRDTPLTDNIIGTQKVIQAAFQQRRKTILNSLSHGLKMEKSEVEKVLGKLKISPLARAENLSVTEFLQLTEDLQVK